MEISWIKYILQYADFGVKVSSTSVSVKGIFPKSKYYCP